MTSIRARLTSYLAVVGAMVIGAGCQGPLPEDEFAAESDLQMTMQAAEGEPRKIEDLVGGLDHEEGILHVEEKSVEVVLKKLRAERVNDVTYEALDEVTGELLRFRLDVHPPEIFVNLFKECPETGQTVFIWQRCPTRTDSSPLTRVWKNSSCSYKVQSAQVGLCSNTSTGSSSRVYAIEAWKCGVGTDYCVEHRATKKLRFNYEVADCNPERFKSITSFEYDYLCKAVAPRVCK